MAVEAGPIKERGMTITQLEKLLSAHMAMNRAIYSANRLVSGEARTAADKEESERKVTTAVTQVRADLEDFSRITKQHTAGEVARKIMDQLKKGPGREQ